MTNLDKINTWNALQPLPVNMTCAGITMINSSEFLIAPYRDRHFGEIYKFNHHLNKLDTYIEYPDDVKSTNHSLAYNNMKHELYLYGTTASMIIIDINTKIGNRIPNCSINCDSWSCLLSIKGVIHLIGGIGNPKHLIWNNANNAFQTMHHFQQYPGIYGAAAIYVASKDIIILIGGQYLNNVHWRYVNVGIWIFHLQTKQWRQIKKQCAWNIARAVISSDEKYIVIAAAINGDNGDEIFILDITNDHTMILRKSNICCPKPGFHHIVRTGDGLKDEILVIGYIKGLFNSNDFINLALPPYYIMQLIAKWYNMESIHWLEWNVNGKDDNDHYVIPLKRILSSIDNNVQEETINF